MNEATLALPRLAGHRTHISLAPRSVPRGRQAYAPIWDEDKDRTAGLGIAIAAGLVIIAVAVAFYLCEAAVFFRALDWVTNTKSNCSLFVPVFGGCMARAVLGIEEEAS